MLSFQNDHLQSFFVDLGKSSTTIDFTQIGKIIRGKSSATHLFYANRQKKRLVEPHQQAADG